MSRENKKVIVCVTNECPFCGERGYSEGEDSAKKGEKIKCEKCGKKFEVVWTRNVEGEKMSKKYEPETMTEVAMIENAKKSCMRDAVEKLGKFIMLYPDAVAGELIEDGICAFEPTGKNKHINKVFVITSLDIDELPSSVKTLLTSHKPSGTMEE